MKLKILIFPAIILAILYLTIWVMVPNYSGAGGILETQAKLAATNEKLGGVTQKENNAASLVRDLNNNSEQQNILVKYLPEKKQDEDIVASISAIAGASGVAVSDIKIADDKKPADDGQIVYDSLGNVVPKVEDPIKSFTADITMKGDYGKIRQFIFSLDSINRLNEMISLKMDRADDETADLKVVLSVRFSYFEKVAKVASVRDEFFARGKFDMRVAEDIRKKAATEIPKIDIGTSGRNNLFAL